MDMRTRLETGRDPWESEEFLVAIEEAIDCDGSECGSAFHDEDGVLEDLPAHFHLKVSGICPKAGPELYAVGGELPKIKETL
jgi:hypothetical protein